MAAYRYWRLYFTSRSTNPHRVLLYDVKMRESSGGTDVAAAGTFTANTSDGSGPPANLNDGNLSTAWLTPFVAQDQLVYVTADLGSAKDISHVELTGSTSADGGILSLPRQCFIAGSNDDLAYTLVGAFYTGTMVPDVAFVLADVQTTPRPVTSDQEAVRLNTTWPTSAYSARVTLAEVTYDPLDSGPLAISGTVKIKDSPDIPVARRVRLFEHATGRLVREVWSGANGAYSIPRLKDNLYFLVSHDHTLQDNAAIKDRIRPEVP